MTVGWMARWQFPEPIMHRWTMSIYRRWYGFGQERKQWAMQIIMMLATALKMPNWRLSRRLTASRTSQALCFETCARKAERPKAAWNTSTSPCMPCWKLTRAWRANVTPALNVSQNWRLAAHPPSSAVWSVLTVRGISSARATSKERFSCWPTWRRQAKSSAGIESSSPPRRAVFAQWHRPKFKIWRVWQVGRAHKAKRRWKLKRWIGNPKMTAHFESAQSPMTANMVR